MAARRVSGTLILLILTMTFLSPANAIAQEEPAALINGLSGVNVAVYTGNQVLSHSFTALKNMFEWMNASAEAISASRIKDGWLDNYDILVFPGGPQSSYASELEDEGKEIIVDFVKNGGSYFGVCGGANFGASSLRFLDGSVRSANELGDEQHLTIMHINRSSTGPDLSECPENVSTMYWYSSYFDAYNESTIIPIARYDHNDEPGMIAIKYDYGTVFLSSPHPEYEEGENRDGTAFGDYLLDPDSEWEMLLQVSRWLIEASPETTPAISEPLDFVPIAIISGSVIAIVVVLVAITKWKRG